MEPTGLPLRSFEAEPVSTWIWCQTIRQLSTTGDAYGLDERLEEEKLVEKAQHPKLACILIQYRYQGMMLLTLRLRPMIGDRDLSPATSKLRQHFSRTARKSKSVLKAIRPGQIRTPLAIALDAISQADKVWYWNYHLPEEIRRGLGDTEDLA